MIRPGEKEAGTLPSYTDTLLAGLEPDALVALMVRDEDRVPRNVIDACAGRGEAMVAELRQVLERGVAWQHDAPRGEWWMTLHAAMILGLVPGEDAGLLMVEYMRRISLEEDEDIQDWLAGWWPALFRNKPRSVMPALRGLCEDRSLEWSVRTHAMEAVVAEAESRGVGPLDEALAWMAAIAADETEDWNLRRSVGSALLDFVPPAHRTLLEDLGERQAGFGAWFSRKDVDKAYAANQQQPQWHRFSDPWKFYSLGAIAERQDRWAREALEEAAADADDFGDVLLPYVREFPKIGRNDPCPCGSGKKYKKCCFGRP